MAEIYTIMIAMEKRNMDLFFKPVFSTRTDRYLIKISSGSFPRDLQRRGI